AREARELELEQDALVGRGRTALQPLQHDAPDPAAGIVLKARHQIDDLAIGHAVIDAPDAVPLAGAERAPGHRIGCAVEEAAQGPLPAQVELLRTAALQAPGGA